MLPLRLVIDTNVLVSAALNPDGLERTTILLAITTPDSTSRLLFWRSMRVCLPVRTSKFARVCACNCYSSSRTAAISSCRADKAGGDYLITGNRKHFPQFWKKTTIITSREFISLAAPHLTS
jgi:hypothetical protein